MKHTDGQVFDSGEDRLTPGGGPSHFSEDPVPATSFSLRQLYFRFEHLIKYCIIGCSGALLDLGVYTLLCCCTNIHYQYINILSTSAGIINNFFLNAYLNFKVRDYLLRRFLIFYAVGCAGLALTALLLFVLIEKLRVYPVVAKTVTIFIVTVVQFVLNKCITFKRKENAKCRK